MIDVLARDHGQALLAALGIDARLMVAAEHPALGWRRAGLMAVTGAPGGLPFIAPTALTAAADGALGALAAIAPGAMLPARGSLLLGERARLLGLPRRGAVSPNGSCRLLMARDGSFALNLARADDWAALPALFGDAVADWDDVVRLSAECERDALLTRGRLLGLAIAADRLAAAAEPFVVRTYSRRAGGRSARPLVVDFSSLWAGPLAGALLQAAGARVVKVESVDRPDGARAGHRGFYDLLNAGKESVALDFSDSADVASLRRLVDRADIVIEASRPRALAALGLNAEAMAARGGVWISVTAYGRSGAPAAWIGFGDDAAVAGGLSAAMRQAWGVPLIAGDAIADPLTGIVAALAGWAGWIDGGGRLVSLAMADVVAHAVALHNADAEEVRRWQAIAQADIAPLYPLRPPAPSAHASGADTEAVLAELANRSWA